VSSRLSGNESCSRKQADVGARAGLSQPSELLTDRSEPAAGGAERVRDGAGAKQHDELAPRRRRRIAEIVNGRGSGAAAPEEEDCRNPQWKRGNRERQC
jgi:hypothetical protein